MTRPEGSAPAPAPARLRLVNFLSRKPLTGARAAWIIASVTVSMTIISRVLIHFRLAEVGVVAVPGPTVGRHAAELAGADGTRIATRTSAARGLYELT